MAADEPRRAPVAAADADRLMARGMAAVRQGRVDTAIACYSEALAAQPDRFEARANLGAALLAARRCGAAAEHLRRASALRPHEAAVLVMLARARAAEGWLADAEAAYRGALAIDPGNADAWLALATLLRFQGRSDDAAACYARALAERPGDADALYGRGLCLRERGDIDAAAASFEAAIAARPDCIDAHYRLAVLRPDARPDARLVQLEALRPRVGSRPAAQRIRYAFTLGRLRETAGVFDAAFEAYAEGNALQWQALGLARTYPEQEALDDAFARRILRAFAHEGAAGSAGAAPGAEAPVFIVGMPRSGTSLVEAMLAMHPALVAGGELRVLPDLLEQTFGFAASAAPDAYPEAVAALPDASLRGLGREYLRRARLHAGGARRVIDKLPGNVLHVGMIRRMLPGAKIVHVRRDPRDACFSCFANLFARDNLPWSYDLGALGRYAVRCGSLVDHWCRSLPADAILTVRYEDLAAAPEAGLRRLLGFLALPWDARCLDFHRARRAVHTVSAGQVRRPAYVTSIGRWKHFERHLGPLLRALGPRAG